MEDADRRPEPARRQAISKGDALQHARRKVGVRGASAGAVITRRSQGGPAAASASATHLMSIGSSSRRVGHPVFGSHPSRR